MRLVVDTSILVSALLVETSLPAHLVVLWRAGRFDLVTAAAQLDELRRVTRYPKLRERLTPTLVGRLVNELRWVAIVAPSLPRVTVCEDPYDNYLLGMAMAGAADFLVTGDKRDLLGLKLHCRDGSAPGPAPGRALGGREDEPRLNGGFRLGSGRIRHGASPSGEGRPDQPRRAAMSKAAFFALLGAVTLSTGAAPAAERATVEPTAPSFVRELGAARTATVGGTVVEVRGRRFVLADAENGRIRVEAKHLRLDGLVAGQMITVTGRLDGDELEAAHAVREDGSVAPPGQKLASDG